MRLKIANDNITLYCEYKVKNSAGNLTATFATDTITIGLVNVGDKIKIAINSNGFYINGVNVVSSIVGSGNFDSFENWLRAMYIRNEKTLEVCPYLRIGVKMNYCSRAYFYNYVDEISYIDGLLTASELEDITT